MQEVLVDAGRDAAIKAIRDAAQYVKTDADIDTCVEVAAATTSLSPVLALLPRALTVGLICWVFQVA